MEKSSRLDGIILLVIGVILLVYPGDTMEVFCRLTGWILVIGGIGEFSIGIIGEKIPRSILIGLIALVAGIIFIVCPEVVISYLPFSVGLVTAAGGFYFICRVAILKNLKSPAGILSLLGGAAALIVGFILMLNAYTAAKLLMVTLGIFFSCSGATIILKGAD